MLVRAQESRGACLVWTYRSTASCRDSCDGRNVHGHVALCYSGHSVNCGATMIKDALFFGSLKQTSSAVGCNEQIQR